MAGRFKNLKTGMKFFKNFFFKRKMGKNPGQEKKTNKKANDDAMASIERLKKLGNG
jgi:hypothetical protein